MYAFFAPANTDLRYARRIQAMNTGHHGLLNAIYDRDNPQLLTFEQDRARFFNGGLGSRWDGVPLQYDSTVSLVSLENDGSEVRAKLYERFASSGSRTPIRSTRSCKHICARTPLVTHHGYPMGRAARSFRAWAIPTTWF